MTIYELNHPTIEFGSISKKAVDAAIKAFNNLTLDDIKNNNVTNRHALLFQFGLAGDFPLLSEYMGAREMLYNIKQDKADNYPKHSAQLVLDRPRIEIAAAKEVQARTGWIL